MSVIISSDFGVKWLCIALGIFSTKLYVVPCTQVYMLYVAIDVSKHCKKMEHSYKKHLGDHENKNLMSIHKSEYMNVIILGCLVMTTLYFPLCIYSSHPLPPQTFRSLCLRHSGKSLSSEGSVLTAKVN